MAIPILTEFEQIFKANPWLAGGFTMMGGGALLASLRSIPSAIFSYFKRCFILSVDITDQTQLYEYFAHWLASQEYAKKSRLVSGSLKSVRVDKHNEVEVLLTPAPGNHFFFYKRRLLWLNRARKEVSNNNSKYNETFYIETLGRNQAIIRHLLEEVRDFNLRMSNNRISVYVNNSSYWRFACSRPFRPMDSIIMEPERLQGLIDDVTQFQQSADWYGEMGIPYHRGYLLYGVPGTGKSSLVAAVASMFGMDIYALNLNSEDMSDTDLIDAALEVPEHSVILLEDVDSIFTERKEADEKASKVTFSGLLNVLDGVFAKEGTLMFMSTNHVELLDAALIRPGRVDYKMHFGYATTYQLGRLFQRFFREATDEEAMNFAESITDDVSMAAVQDYLLQHRHTMQNALINIALLKEEIIHDVAPSVTALSGRHLPSSQRRTLPRHIRR